VNKTPYYKLNANDKVILIELKKLWRKGDTMWLLIPIPSQISQKNRFD
jgi:hypothetical protein